MPEETSIDIEENWKRLRKKLEQDLEKESELEESIESGEEEISSEQFTEFMQGPVEVKAPVLERIEIPQEQEQGVVSESLNAPTMFMPEQETPEFGAGTRDEPGYITGMGNLPEQTQTRVEPPVLTPRDTMPQEEIPRHELLDQRSFMSPIRPRENIYPELLEPEDKDKKYYKVIK